MIIIVKGRSWDVRLGGGLVPTPHQGRQERNGAWRGGKGEHKAGRPANWECGMEGLWAPGHGGAEAYRRTVSTMFPFEFLTWKSPSISLPTPWVKKVMLICSCCEWAGGPRSGRTAQSHPGATGGQEAITRVRPLRGFVEILGWNLDFSSVQNLETWVSFS